MLPASPAALSVRLVMLFAWVALLFTGAVMPGCSLFVLSFSALHQARSSRL